MIWTPRPSSWPWLCFPWPLPCELPCAKAAPDNSVMAQTVSSRKCFSMSGLRERVAQRLHYRVEQWRASFPDKNQARLPAESGLVGHRVLLLLAVTYCLRNAGCDWRLRLWFDRDRGQDAFEFVELFGV